MYHAVFARAQHHFWSCAVSVLVLQKQRSAYSSRGLRLSDMDVSNKSVHHNLVLGVCCVFPSGARGSVWIIKIIHLLNKDCGMSVRALN